MTDPKRADVETVAVGILNRRIKPDFFSIVDKTWVVDHDKELAIAAILAYRAYLKENGFAIVPREPTWGVDKMTGAGASELPALDGICGQAGKLASNIYKAMIAAYEAESTEK